MKRDRTINTYKCIVCELESELELEDFYYYNYKNGICRQCINKAVKEEEKEKESKLIF